MKIFFLLLVGAFICPIFKTIGQNLREGYILQLSGDTLRGQIEFNPGEMIVRLKSKDGSIKEYAPTEIAGFQFLEGKYFVSKSVKNGAGDRELFLEYLVSGIVDAYVLIDKRHVRYFIETEENGVEELISEDRQITKNGKTYSYKAKPYIGVLYNAFSKSSKIKKKAERAPLQSRSLIELVKDYHEEVCDTGEKCVVYEKDIPRATLQIALNAMYSHSNYTVKSTDRYGDFFFKDNAGFNPSAFTAVGITVNKNFPQVDKNLIIQWDLQYIFKERLEGTSIESPTPSIVLSNDYSIEMTKLSNTISFKYNLFNGWVQPEIGINYRLMLSGEYYSSFQSTFVPTGEVTQINETNTLSQNRATPELGFSTGLSFGKKVVLTLRYNIEVGGDSFRANQLSALLYVPIWKFDL